MPIGLVYDPIFLDHVNPPGHPERVERLRAVTKALEDAGLLTRMTPVPARSASVEELTRIHSLRHVSEIRSLAGLTGYLDADTYYSEGSAQAALLAAGGVTELATRVWRGELAGGMALVRPPGHHAEANRAMGFCLFNNIAVAAAALRQAGAQRVAIFDWDVHHGNGTQHSFESDPAVLYLSTHQFPFYPGTGAASEVGVGDGRGATVNFPMPGGSGDLEFSSAIELVIAPVIEQFRPEIMLISAGFDTYVDDPLAGMRVTEEGFAEMARRMRSLADRVCQGKIVYVLEGGYDVAGLAAGVKGCVRDLLDPKAPAVLHATSTAPAFQSALAAVRKAQSPFWKV